MKRIYSAIVCTGVAIAAFQTPAVANEQENYLRSVFITNCIQGGTGEGAPKEFMSKTCTCIVDDMGRKVSLTEWFSAPDQYKPMLASVQEACIMKFID